MCDRSTDVPNETSRSASCANARHRTACSSCHHEDFEKFLATRLPIGLQRTTSKAFVELDPRSKTCRAAARAWRQADNDSFLRAWHEVSRCRASTASLSRSDAEADANGSRIIKGENFGKWYGNNEFVVNWENDGSEHLKARSLGRAITDREHQGFLFREGITWSDITYGKLQLHDFIRRVSFSMSQWLVLFPEDQDRQMLLAFLNSKVGTQSLRSCSTQRFISESVTLRTLPVLDDLGARN